MAKTDGRIGWAFRTHVNTSFAKSLIAQPNSVVEIACQGDNLVDILVKLYELWYVVLYCITWFYVHMHKMYYYVILMRRFFEG